MVYNLYFDIAALILNIVLVLIVCIRKTHVSFKAFVFKFMICMHLFATTFDIISVFTISSPEKYSLLFNYFINIGYYLTYNLAGSLYIMYGLTVDKKRAGSKFRRGIIFGIYVAIFILILTTPLTKFVFYFDQNMVYNHGPALYLLYGAGLCSVLYVLYLKLSNTEEQSGFQIVINISYAVVLLSGFTYHVFNPSILIEMFIVDIGYFVIFLSLENPEQFLYKTLSVYNKTAFDEKLFSNVSKDRRFNVILFTPQNSDVYKNQNTRSELFSLEKKIINRLTSDKDIDKELYVLSELSFAIITFGQETQYISKINTMFTEDIEFDNYTTNVTMSYGVMHYPDVATNFDEANMVLEDILYKINKHVSTQTVEADFKAIRSTKKKDVEMSLISAIKNDGIFIEYEPIFNLSDGYAKQAEAIVMIKTKDGNIRLNKEYMEIAEEDGLISDISEIALKKIGDFIRKTSIENMGIEHIIINLSRANLLNINFPNKLRFIINKYHLNPESISFKLVDLDLSANEEQIRMNMKNIANLGFLFVVDNYGSNSINAKTLITLPVIGVKFDEELINQATKDVKIRVILTNLVNMIKDLGYSMCAGNINDVVEDDLLKSLCFDFAQGPFYGKQCKEDEYIDFYKNQLNSLLSNINRN